MATYSWTGRSDDNWANPANWSGDVVPTGTDDILILGTQGYQITLTGTAEAAAAITLGNPGSFAGQINVGLSSALSVTGDSLIGDGNVIIAEGSTLTLGGTLTFQGGEFIAQGVVAGGTFVEDGGVLSHLNLDATTFILQSGSFATSGTLVGVTLEAAAPIVLAEDTSLTFSGLTVLDGTAPGTLDGSAGGFALLGSLTQTLDDVTVLLGAFGEIGSVGTLTLGPAVTLTGTDLNFAAAGAGDAIVNDGTIIETIDTLASSFASPFPTLNRGFLQVDGQGSLAVASSTIDNAGTLILSGVTVDPVTTAGGFVNSGLVYLEGAGANLVPAYSGTVANAGGTIHLGADTMLFSEGVVAGGTILSDPGAELSLPDSTLDAVALVGSLFFGQDTDLTLDDDVTLAGAGGAAAALTVDDAALVFDGPRVLDTIDITLGGGPSAAGASSGGGGITGTTLTLGADATIAFGGPATNGSSIGASATLINQGTIEAWTGGVVLGGAASANATLVVNDGVILSAAGEHLQVHATTFENNGVLSLVAGASLQLGTVTLPTLLSITDDGGTIDVGDLQLGGSLLSLGAGDRLTIGTVADGTVDAVAGDFTFNQSGGQLDDITWLGSLVVDNQILSVAQGLTIEQASGSLPGSLVIDGLSGELSLDDSETLDGMAITIGDTIGSAASLAFDGIDAIRGNLTLGANTTTTFAGDNGEFFVAAATEVENDGTILASLGTAALAGIDATEFLNRGVVSIENDLGTFGAAASLVTNDGVVAVADGILAIAADLAGDAAAILGTGTFDINAGGILVLYGSFSGQQSLVFTGGPSTLLLSDPGGTASPITGFGAGETVVLPNLLFTGGTPTYDDGQLVVPGSSDGHAVLQTLDLGFAPGFGVADVTLKAGPTDGTMVIVPCYAAGTRIATPQGEVEVERLAAGMEVVTASGATRPIRWIGRRCYDGRFVAGNRDILPVVFRAGALGDGVPRRDLCVSPRHAMFVDGVLIPAGRLVNGRSVVQAAAVTDIAYFHIELDSHDILSAEGAPAESFLDCDSRMLFQNAHEYVSPGGRAAPAMFCAARVEDGDLLQSVRRRIAARAGLAADHAEDAATPGALDGRIDLIDHETVSGWAYDAARPHTPVGLEILVDGVLVGRVIANTERADLRRAGMGDGCCAFAYRFVPALSPGASHRVEVRRDADQARLPGGAGCLAADPGRPGPLDGRVDVCDGRTVEGWARDGDWPDVPVRLEVFDGRRVIGQVLACRYRADLTGAGIGRCGFVFVVDPAMAVRDARFLRVRRVSDGALLERKEEPSFLKKRSKKLSGYV